jgi:hypothetical protein
MGRATAPGATVDVRAGPPPENKAQAELPLDQPFSREFSLALDRGGRRR